jgi:hypothetical protein
VTCTDLPSAAALLEDVNKGATGTVEVPVHLHLMEAKLDLTDHQRAQRHLNPSDPLARSLYAPAAGDAPGSASDTWTQALSENRLWESVRSIWSPTIKLSLRRVERCAYEPAMLRLESTYPDPCAKGRRACRDSMVFPDDPTSMPWRRLLYRSINKMFTDDFPNVLHIMAWWWIGESSIFRDSNTGTGELLIPALDAAFARATGRGGPVVWMSTYGCLYRSAHPGGAVPSKPSNLAGVADRKACARLLAHEIGHALGLHHVQKGDVDDVKGVQGNLMLRQYIADGLEPWQKEAAQEEARRRFNSR